MALNWKFGTLAGLKNGPQVQLAMEKTKPSKQKTQVILVLEKTYFSW
jgi:hypothetical protein